MDTPVKALVNMTLAFIGLLLLLSCLTFFMAYDNATTAMYGVIQDLEIYGNDPERVAAYAKRYNTVIDVQPVKSSYGSRFSVTVSYDHVFAWLKWNRRLYVTATTRAVEF